MAHAIMGVFMIEKTDYTILNTIGEVYTLEARKILEEIGQVVYHTPSQNELLKIIGGYDAALIGLGLLFNREVLQAAKKLKVIATATTGLDHIDLAAAEEQGITVLSLQGEDEFLDTITGTAELAWGLILDLLRRTPWAFDAVKDYEWQRENFRGHNLYGKTLGIVGLGRLGRWVARYGVAFGMQIVFYDPAVVQSEGIMKVNEQRGLSLLGETVLSAAAPLKKVDFETLLAESDIISIHAHLTPKTQNMFNKSAFEQMKPTAYLINTSRGKIVNERDLLQAIEDKKIAGYGTDVLADEIEFTQKDFIKNPLVEYSKTHDNCIILPHIGGMTHESRETTDIFIAKKLKNYLEDLPQ